MKNIFFLMVLGVLLFTTVLCPGKKNPGIEEDAIQEGVDEGADAADEAAEEAADKETE